MKSTMMKAVILIGGPSKGTRFRPLSLDVPKLLFPIAGLPMIQHHIEVCVRIREIKEILIIGYYPSSEICKFVEEMIVEYGIGIRYLQEYTPLGTAGGLFHFRDQIRYGNPFAFYVMNGDVCGDFPLQEMYDFYRKNPQALVVVAGTEATRNQSLNYGCIVSNKETSEIKHYVEKPSTFVSTFVNCGVYLFSVDIFNILASVYKKKEDGLMQDDMNLNFINGNSSAVIHLETEVLKPLAGTGTAYVCLTSNWWSQLKTAGSAIYANRHYLQLYRKWHTDRLYKSSSNDASQQPLKSQIIDDVYIHHSARIHQSAVIGPNVSIGANAVIGAGTRIRDSIILDGANIGDHCLIMYSIIGRASKIGDWCRIEGTPCDPNPNKPFAKMDNLPLFNSEGRLNPSITVLGGNVQLSSEIVILNSIVLPYKVLTRSFKNEIIL